jgi:hypothetical protein
MIGLSYLGLARLGLLSMPMSFRNVPFSQNGFRFCVVIYASIPLSLQHHGVRQEAIQAKGEE